MERSIQQVARLAGTTSRTLRHYDEIGLLPPSRIGHNGYRYYDESALIRLQRILLLRELGLGLPQIADLIAAQANEAQALTTHLSLLRAEQDRLARQIAAVQHTINSLQGSEKLMAQDMFDGFDHTVHREEVEQRWGKEAYASSDAWWRGLGKEGQDDWKRRSKELGNDWIAAARDPGTTPDSPTAQALARRHVQWLTGIPGTPAADSPEHTRAYVLGLAEMYVADERFAANYGGAVGASFVRDALQTYVGTMP
ncbi:MerR family transcriptional regulator [Paeniglutamicibacter psychrophenolicus]|uniref:MerR family transcriptional regulator n=1 Tax=Paeniglutamicibacter psychrophenolicus TaxID=257454 RepID=UPI002780CC5D|nr:MerR family transcriptional regulator [Paeniglutamicibacter psychrophenolicus]MDQ0092286.1 DNA-binding transcriptional MerR regulator [Paeniglutamicibacter psychrophenolicus]